jgi:hypothetical protein
MCKPARVQNAAGDNIATFLVNEDATRPGTIMPMREEYLFADIGVYTITVRNCVARLLHSAIAV